MIDIPKRLQDWLTKIEARHVSTHTPKTAPQHRYDVWATRASLLVTLSTQTGGFDVFTPNNTLNIDATLADAEARLR
jgi:hypothetical protein